MMSEHVRNHHPQPQATKSSPLAKVEIASSSPLLVIRINEDHSVSIGDSLGFDHRIDPGSVMWAFYAVLSDLRQGEALEIGQLASRIDLALAAWEQRAHEEAMSRSRHKGRLTGDERFEQTQLRKRGRSRATYSMLEPAQIVSRIQAVIGKT